MSDNDYEEDDEFYDEDEGDCLLRDEGLYGEMYARGGGDNRDYERDMSCDGFFQYPLMSELNSQPA